MESLLAVNGKGRLPTYTELVKSNISFQYLLNMDDENRKENAAIDEGRREKTSPNLHFLALKADFPREPRCSTDTLRSLDITQNIPRVLGSTMDAEDSPWGGKLTDRKSTRKQCD